MQIRRFIAVVIALSVLALGVLSACGGGADEAGTINQDVTIGTGTEATPVEGGDAGTAESVEEEAPAETTAAAEGDAAAGEAIFASAGCAGCHTLAAAGANGAVGPNLDDVKPSYEATLDIVTNGRGAMPAYSGQLSEADIQNVSAFVAQNAGQ